MVTRTYDSSMTLFRTAEAELLSSIKAHLDELRQLQSSADERFGAEDLIYRYYHGSFKVFGIQTITLSIVTLLSRLAPGRELNAAFHTIVEAGTHVEKVAGVKVGLEKRPGFFIPARIDGIGEHVPSPLPGAWASVLYGARLT